MRKILALLLAALALAAAVPSAWAQVVVRTPAVSVVVPARPGLVVPPRAQPVPAVPVNLDAPPPVPFNAAPALPVPSVTVAAPPVVQVMKVQSVTEFVASFSPATTAGRYETLLMHPCTNCPVKVCFHLPCGCPKKIRCIKGGFEVRYGLFKAVTVRFLADGTVRVRD